MEQPTSSLRDKLLVRLLFRLGCRVSEALAIKIGDIDFEKGNVIILHLKTRISLQCPKCKVRLGRRHQFCPECGDEINKTIKHQQEHRRIRTLPVDADTIKLLKEYLASSPIESHDDSGDALRLLQEHLGHASFNTTAKYRIISGNEHRDWYDRLWADQLEDSK
jgi:integrase/recombinase XerD